MARSKSRSGSSRRGSAAAAEVAEVEVVSEESGMGFEAGLAIMTTIILLAAVLMIDYDRGAHYGEGMLFKGKYAANAAAASE
ncbi:MAG: hypothetical protein ACPGPE_17615 [Planctomycetota bacterium]|jgi:hypothetical protein